MNRQQRRRQAPAWRPNLFSENPIFADLVHLVSSSLPTTWPGPTDYNRLAQRRQALFQNEFKLRFCRQQQPMSALDFETWIQQQRQIPCRPEEWHDLFNALMWLRFPQTKSCLNQIHVERGCTTRKLSANQRCLLRNFATLLDEAGVIIAYQRSETLSAHQAHQWEQLFLDQRDGWWRNQRPFIIGHGLYEQCLMPYLGLTGKAYYWPVDSAFFQQPLEQQYGALDQALADYLYRLLEDSRNTPVEAPITLLPLPILGLPGWWSENNDPAFYRNTHYFRPLRQHQARP